jgi:plastocyanin
VYRSMALSILKWAAVVIIVAVLAFVVGRRTGSETTDTRSAMPTPTTQAGRATNVPSTQRNVRIEVYSDTVNPSSVTIRSGDVITIVNMSASALWPIADAGTACSGLDSRRALRQGESYSLTMRERGSCTYHDASEAQSLQRRGTIIVQ